MHSPAYACRPSRDVALERVALRAGDYAAFLGDSVIAVVERKALDDFCKSLVDGTLGFVMGELARLGTTAVVVEGTYTQLLRRGFVDGAWLGDLLVRLHVRYPAVPIVFVETRALGERWTFAFFAAAAAERIVGADAGGSRRRCETAAQAPNQTGPQTARQRAIAVQSRRTLSAVGSTHPSP